MVVRTIKFPYREALARRDLEGSLRSDNAHKALGATKTGKEAELYIKAPEELREVVVSTPMR